MTGLAAEVSPARAAVRHAGEAEVGSIQLVVATRKAADIVELAMAAEAAPLGEAARVIPPVPQPLARIFAYVPQVDRALE